MTLSRIKVDLALELSELGDFYNTLWVHAPLNGGIPVRLPQNVAMLGRDEWEGALR